ncbi:sugar ABC transporter substrate-binding protein [Hydrogenovibrio sp. SC-1]|uniref:substrate-binding domain-containing protein n=1 Tax=Hydrogenovibrio sp. SC-1 TaxID=2065820 RepID=UPI000C7E5FDA|nr:substrate-binding domain-containing protein [Hydrogenovibrio sp. SC-1]PLA73431.1 sugar ABC transporter substrate-binding protein [Hydrogenovibrio sp. SC-1]
MLSWNRLNFTLLLNSLLFILLSFQPAQANTDKTSSDPKLAYIVSDTRIPFWDIMARGAKQAAESLGYELEIYSSNNLAKLELKNTTQVIKQSVDGIILSPTTSFAASTILKLANKASIPVVIADIGADSVQYVSYIGSDNETGAYKLGQILAQKMKAKNWQNGSVGTIAIPQKRANGQARTAGFLRALDEHQIKNVALKQQVTFSYQETYDYAKQMIQKHPNLRAIWLQGSNRYQAALDAISDANKTDDILLICFDAEPEFLELIPQQIIVGSAMQQPYLIGEKAVTALDRHLNGKSVQKIQKLPVLAVSADNIQQKHPIIKRNVLGITPKEE